MIRRFAILLSVIALFDSPRLFADEPATVVFDQPQTALISGFRKNWDTPLVIDGPAGVTNAPRRAFDAVHRSLLVRFPGVADAIAAELEKGRRVEKAELVLPWEETELNSTESAGYNQRLSFGALELHQRLPAEWHAVAWALRRPWIADPERGPTYNAFRNGVAHWSKYGAQDPQRDRVDRLFGPTEVSHRQTVGRMDVTASLSDEAFGRSLAERLRRLEDCGFLVRKWEVYDWRYREAGQGAYEWAVATGGRGIVVKKPQLVVTFAPGKVELGRLPSPPAEIQPEGRPTAVMPSADKLQRIIDRYALRPPDWMPDWQWERVQELDQLGGGYRIPGTPEDYAKWIDTMLADPPRYWNGWDVPDRLLTFYLYRDALPAPVRESYCDNYWTAWLLPDRPTKDFEHPQAIELWHKNQNVYYEKTGDWRGNASFYRDGYCYAMSTMNFNHTAAMGALLGGQMIGSEYAMADGRHGLENWPLRTWCWYDGSTQESVDHYYFGLTLSDQKMFADFGPTPLDRMMGLSMLAKSVEELTSAYHPALRRFLASSTRTSVPQYLLVTQDGLQHIVHTLSRQGALHDLQNPDLPGRMPVIGHDTPPGRIAQQTVTGPWAPEWAANMVDEKPIPYQMTNAYKQWGGHAAHPLWRRTWLGRHYGLASTDLYPSCVPILGHWRREDRPVENVQDLGTMLLRYGINTTLFANTTHGWVAPWGAEAALQHQNKLLVVTSPYDLRDRQDIKSLQSSIALYNYQQPKPTWEIFIDGQPVTALPAKARAGQCIAIRDGVTYLGIIALPATDLGRQTEVELVQGDAQTWNNADSQAALVINSYNLQRETPLDAAADWARIDRAYGGFAVEFGDVSEYRDFAAFQEHLRGARLETRWDDPATTLEVTYASGSDTLEMGVKTDYRQGPTPNCFTYRKVNGEWPYLPPGLERDTSLTQQGSTGRLEKNGARLLTTPGHMAYLQTEPLSGTYAAFNPLPDPNLFAFTAPGGITVKADGRLGIGRVIVQPQQNRIEVDHAWREEQVSQDLATALVVFGARRAPAVTLNGQPLRKGPGRIKLPEGTAYVIPLVEGRLDPKRIQERLTRIEQLLALKEWPDVTPHLVTDWYLLGPFPNADGAGFDTAYPPEAEAQAGKGRLNLEAAYEGAGQRELKWQRLPAGAPPGPIDLAARFDPRENVCAYAFTRITSDRKRTVTLYTGSDDTITLWLNGEKLLAKNVARGVAVDSDRLEATLQPGENTVLLKICQGGGGWGFCFRVGDEWGLPLSEGIRWGFETGK